MIPKDIRFMDEFVNIFNYINNICNLLHTCMKNNATECVRTNGKDSILMKFLIINLTGFFKGGHPARCR